MEIISRDEKVAYGVVTRAEHKSRLPFFAASFYPRCCLEDAERYRVRRGRVRLGFGDESRELGFSTPEYKFKELLPKVGDRVRVASTAVSVLGLPVPFMGSTKVTL